jgi:hypothetical protein
LLGERMRVILSPMFHLSSKMCMPMFMRAPARGASFMQPAVT